MYIFIFIFISYNDHRPSPLLLKFSLRESNLSWNFCFSSHLPVPPPSLFFFFAAIYDDDDDDDDDSGDPIIRYRKEKKERAEVFERGGFDQALFLFLFFVFVFCFCFLSVFFFELEPSCKYILEEKKGGPGKKKKQGKKVSHLRVDRSWYCWVRENFFFVFYAVLSVSLFVSFSVGVGHSFLLFCFSLKGQSNTNKSRIEHNRAST